MAFVRSSKFRHVFGTAAKRDKCYDNIKISKSPHESNMSSVNEKFLAVVLEVQGGGSFTVLPLEKVGRFDINLPKVAGHKSLVLDIMWNPFNDNQIASASEDCKIKIWQIPDGGLSQNMTESVATLEGHQKKVMHIQWHPCAENILASAGADPCLIVWNVETEEVLMRYTEFPDLIYSICWDYNGSRIATTCKDKKIRVLDARKGENLNEGPGHVGNKPSRVVFCGKTNKLFTTGFSRMSERQCAVWNPEDLSKSLQMDGIDNSSGVQFPFWDEGTKMVYLVGKSQLVPDLKHVKEGLGDTQIRYFEVKDEPEENGKYVFFLSMFQAKEPQRSVCALPKRNVDYMKCEVMRFFKLGNNKGLIEPISMTVPRKSDMFQEDIFPPCPSGESALSAEEWWAGTDKDPLLKPFQESSGGGGGGGGATASKGTKAKTVTSVKKTTAPKTTVTAAAPEPAVRTASAAGEPKSLEEYHTAYTELVNANFDLYRKAYKELEAENRHLKEKLGML